MVSAAANQDKKEVLVVEWRGESDAKGKWTARRMDLHHSTVQQLCGGQEMEFCYYKEATARVTYVGLRRVCDDELRVFVKLVRGEPVDLPLAEWHKQFARHGEFIPSGDPATWPRQ